jgi:transposase
MSKLGSTLVPMYDAMVNVVKNDGYIQADETRTRVLDQDKKGACHLGYYWVYHAPLKRMVIFDYQRERNKEAPQKILDNFQGNLQTDAYVSYKDYHINNGMVHLAC